MNLQPLFELRERLESSMIAGVSLIGDDFRLARAVEQMAPLAGASPVFKRIYDTAKSALVPGCPDLCGAVLDAYALTDAVLCTQGIVEAEGEIEEIDLPEGGRRSLSNAPYSAVAPLLEALTTSGSGHYSTVVDMHRDHPELFRDYRLKDAMIKGLGASYSELAEQIEKWLCEEGEDIIPLLKHGLDPKGKREMVRRVHIIEAVGKEKENDWYISLLDTAEKEVREAAIFALRHCQENTGLLLDLIKGEKGVCKKAAQAALAYMDTPEALAFWEKVMKKNPGLTAPFLAFNTSGAVSDMVADALEEVTGRLLDSVKEKVPAEAADVSAFDALLRSLNGKSSPALRAWFWRVGQRPTANALDKLVDAKNKQVQFSSAYGPGGYGSYNHSAPFTQTLPTILTNAILYSPSRPLVELADELFCQVGVEFFKPALAAALLTRPAREVYDRFISYIGKKNIYYDACVKSFSDLFLYLSFDENAGKYEIAVTVQDPLRLKERGVAIRRDLFENLDRRWFDFYATGALDRVQNSANFGRLIDPKDEYVCNVMGEYFYQKALSPSADSRPLFFYLRTCGWVGEKCRGLVVASAKKNFNNSYWYFYNLVCNAPMTDAQKAEELEQVIEMVKKKRVNIKNWDSQKVEEWCAQLRASGKGI